MQRQDFGGMIFSPCKSAIGKNGSFWSSHGAWGWLGIEEKINDSFVLRKLLNISMTWIFSVRTCEACPLLSKVKSFHRSRKQTCPVSTLCKVPRPCVNFERSGQGQFAKKRENTSIGRIGILRRTARCSPFYSMIRRNRAPTFWNYVKKSITYTHVL